MSAKKGDAEQKLSGSSRIRLHDDRDTRYKAIEEP